MVQVNGDETVVVIVAGGLVAFQAECHAGYFSGGGGMGMGGSGRASPDAQVNDDDAVVSLGYPEVWWFRLTAMMPS